LKLKPGLGVDDGLHEGREKHAETHADVADDA
jgi:hypothetical protein